MSRGRRLPNVLTEAQAAAILAVPNVATTQGLRLRTIMEAMYRAGLRIAEVAALRPMDINLAESMIHVVAGKGKKDRLVYIHPDLLPWLQAWAQARPPDAPGFFDTRRGEAIVSLKRGVTRRAIQLAAAKAAAQYPHLGIDPSRIANHTWRHTAATEMIRGSHNVALVQKFLGHADVSTTSIYCHMDVDDMREYMLQAAARG